MMVIRFLFGSSGDLVFVKRIKGFGVHVKGMNEGLEGPSVDGRLRRWGLCHRRRPASRLYPGNDGTGRIRIV